MTDGYLWFEGLPFPVLGFSSEGIKEACAKFVLKDEDTVLLSYPKSGKETGQEPSVRKTRAVFLAHSAEGWRDLTRALHWGGRSSAPGHVHSD